MPTVTGVDEAGLPDVLDEISRAGLSVISITRTGGTYTIVYGEAENIGSSSSAGTGSTHHSEGLPSKPPVPNMDEPELPPPGPSGTFVFARKRGPKVIVYTDADGREEVREGGSRSWRNCNPGNIRKGDFSINCGAIGDDGSFAIFPSESVGTDAIISLLKSKAYIDLSLKNAVFRYAPPSENNSEAYADFIHTSTGIALDTRLSTLKIADFRKLAKTIRQIEGWTPGEIRSNAPLSPLVSDVSGVGSSAASATKDWMDIARAEAALPALERTSWDDPGENPRILNYFRVGASWFDPAEGDEVDWCAAFVNYCLVTSGHPGTDHPGARSFFWNKNGQFAVLEKPVYGAIAVRRYSPFSDPQWKTGSGHVGFITGFTDSSVTLLGGNQSDTVRESTYALVSKNNNGEILSKFVAFLMPAIN